MSAPSIAVVPADEGTSRLPVRGFRPARLREAASFAPVDVARARRTVPRGRTVGDDDPTPGVDLALWTLHVRFQRTGTPHDLGALVEEYTRYAVGLARRMYREGVPLDDLRQVALEALVVALQRFDCNRSRPFCGYATPTILGALKRHYRDQGWTVRIPRRLDQLVVPARRSADHLTQQLGRQPTVEEVAADLHVGADDILLADMAVAQRRVHPLDAVDGEGQPVLRVGGLDPNLLLAEERAVVVEAMEHLSERDRTVLGRYFFQSRTQTEIGQEYGVSQMQVSRWINSSLQRLRSRIPAA